MSFTRFLWGLYAWLIFLLGLSAAVVFAIVVPGLERRRRWVTRVGHYFFQAAGIPASVHGLHHIPDGHCVVVANHASYLDGVILQTYLPPQFSYVIKSEMRKIPVAHYFLRRIGSKFVERYVASGSARDARVLLRAASTGESLAFFPEGTFVSEVGLGRFRLGAFAAAIKGQLPVVPVIIRGSRAILPAGRILPCRGALEIEIADAIAPGDPAYGSAAQLAEAARQAILRRLHEPDLLVTANREDRNNRTPGP